MKSSHLINLLPPKAMGDFRQYRRSRVFSRLFIAFTYLVCLVAVFCIVAWRYVSIVQEAESQRLTVTKRSQELHRAETFSQKLSAFSSDLSVVRQLREPQYDPAVLTNTIVAALPKNAQILSLDIVFAKGNGTPSTGTALSIQIAGNAKMRADVLAFQHALEALPFVARVDAPLENIIKPEDTTFHFTLTLVPPA